MAREQKGAVAMTHRRSHRPAKDSKHDRPPPRFFMGNERSKQQCVTTVRDLSMSINAPIGAKSYPAARVPNLPLHRGHPETYLQWSIAALGSVHDAAPTIGMVFLKRSATAATILADGAGLPRIGTLGAPSNSV
jgi:hypothetical protein